MIHQPYSPFVGQNATFEADPETVKEIQQEFQPRPTDSTLFHSPQLDKKRSLPSLLRRPRLYAALLVLWVACFLLPLTSLLLRLESRSSTRLRSILLPGTVSPTDTMPGEIF